MYNAKAFLPKCNIFVKTAIGFRLYKGIEMNLILIPLYEELTIKPIWFLIWYLVSECGSTADMAMVGHAHMLFPISHLFFRDACLLTCISLGWVWNKRDQPLTGPVKRVVMNDIQDVLSSPAKKTCSCRESKTTSSEVLKLCYKKKNCMECFRFDLVLCLHFFTHLCIV